MMASERKKPRFLRKDWHKKIKLGSKIKKKRKWRNPVGISNKIRKSFKGHSRKPKIGWGSSEKNNVVRVENLKQLQGFKGKEILIGSIGKKKRDEIVKKANEMKIKILNKYKQEKKQNATS